MKSVRTWSLALAIVLWGGATVASAERAAEALQGLLAHPALRGARVSVLVSDLGSGAVLLERDSLQSLIPASNQKLIVAAAALDHWGPSHRFETPIRVDGPIDEKGVLHGRLWVVGQGDPSLVSESLWKLAEEIRLLGIRQIRGGLGVDTSYFDAVGTHPDWAPLSRRAYEAPTGAFAANYSSFRIDVAAARVPGGLAKVAVAPQVSYFRVGSDAVSLEHGGHLQLALEPLPDGSGESVRVSGVVALDAEPKTYWRSVAFPGRYAASLLRQQLEAQGIRVSGPVRFRRVPEDAKELLRFRGEPVGLIVCRLNKWSNNFIAEQLTKALGAETAGPPGRWATGIEALRHYLRRIGVPDEQVVVADGSGLSPRNRNSAAALVAVLNAGASAFLSGPEFLASLPLGALDGTLEDRMVGLEVPVRGKTGHLGHVASFTGLVQGAGGSTRAFSVLVNGARGGRLEIDAAVDAFIAGLSPAPGEDQSSSAE